MRERVTSSFAVVGPITDDQTRMLAELLGTQLELTQTSVTTWARPSSNPDESSDGIAIGATVDAEDDFDAILKFGVAVRAVLDAIGWRQDVARLEAEVVRLVPHEPARSVIGVAVGAAGPSIDEMGYAEGPA